MTDKVTPRHIAFIMDGNGRWAKKRLLPRKAGHRQGVKALEKVVDACEKRGVEMVTFYAFSTENWAESMDLVSAVVSWNIDSGDWLLPGADTVVSNVTGSVRSGNIVLLTDSEATGAQTAEALGTLIDRLQADGFTIVTLSELVATDEDLAEELDISKVSMPEDAVLPTVPADDEGSSA